MDRVVTFELNGNKVFVYDNGEYDIPYDAYLITGKKRTYLDSFDSLTQCCEWVIQFCFNN